MRRRAISSSGRPIPCSAAFRVCESSQDGPRGAAFAGQALNEQQAKHYIDQVETLIKEAAGLP